MGLGYRPPDIWKGIRLLPVSSADGMGAYLTKVGDDESGKVTPGMELARADLKWS